MRGKEEYRELRKGQGREVEGKAWVVKEAERREWEGNESMEGWQIKK